MVMLIAKYPGQHHTEYGTATITTKTVETSQTGGSCPGAIAVFTDTWQLDVFPIATLTLLSCILVLLTALIISHITRIRRFARTSPVLVSPPSPSVVCAPFTCLALRWSSHNSDAEKPVHRNTKQSTFHQRRRREIPPPYSRTLLTGDPY